MSPTGLFHSAGARGFPTRAGWPAGPRASSGQQARVGTGVRRPASRGGADASKAPGPTARRRGYCNRRVVQSGSFTPSPLGSTGVPQRLDVGEGLWSLPRPGFLRPRTCPAGVGPRCLAPASIQARSAQTPQAARERSPGESLTKATETAGQHRASALCLREPFPQTPAPYRVSHPEGQVLHELYGTRLYPVSPTSSTGSPNCNALPTSIASRRMPSVHTMWLNLDSTPGEVP